MLGRTVNIKILNEAHGLLCWVCVGLRAALWIWAVKQGLGRWLLQQQHRDTFKLGCPDWWYTSGLIGASASSNMPVV